MVHKAEECTASGMFSLLEYRVYMPGAAILAVQEEGASGNINASAGQNGALSD